MNTMFQTFMRWLFAILAVVGAGLMVFGGATMPISIGAAMVVVALAGMIKFTVTRR